MSDIFFKRFFSLMSFKIITDLQLVAELTQRGSQVPLGIEQDRWCHSGGGGTGTAPVGTPQGCLQDCKPPCGRAHGGRAILMPPTQPGLILWRCPCFQKALLNGKQKLLKLPRTFKKQNVFKRSRKRFLKSE